MVYKKQLTAVESKKLLVKNYNDYASRHPHILQVSFPRSGRHWVQRMIQELLGQEVHEVDMALGESKEWFNSLPGYPLQYCTSHGLKDYLYFSHVKYVLLVRDPRDSIYEQFLRFDENNSWGGYYDNGVDNPVQYLCNVEMTDWIYGSGILDFHPFILKYERLCLYPEETLADLLRFVDRQPIKPIKDVVAQYDEEVYASGRDRYLKYSLVWQRGSRLSGQELETIWTELEPYMKTFGYTREGHSDKLLEDTVDRTLLNIAGDWIDTDYISEEGYVIPRKYLWSLLTRYTYLRMFANIPGPSGRSITNRDEKLPRLLALGVDWGHCWPVFKGCFDEVCGVEIRDWAVERGRKEGKDIKEGVIDDLQYPDDYFDAVSSRHVLGWGKDAKAIVSGIYRVTKPGGWSVHCIVCTRDGISPIRHAAYTCELSYQGWEQAFKEQGFEIVNTYWGWATNIEDWIIVARKPEL